MAILYAPRLWANSDSLHDLMDRFNNYAISLGEVSDQQQKLVILAIAKDEIDYKEFTNSQFLEVLILKKGLLSRVKLLVRLVKSVSKERVVIAGDPFFSFWTLWVMQKLFLNPARIQISIHGLPLGRLGHSGFNLRIFALKCASRKADSIRVVSNHLSNLLQADWGITPDKILIAPIPVQFSPGMDLQSRRREILIVGRLHEERGVSLAIEIALSVLSKDANACLVVIGDGPLKSKVESCVLQSRVGDRVSLLGRLPHSDVLERMGKSSVLLTAAPQEGFGLTIREAAYSGLSVVALRNLGTTEAEGELAQILSLFSSREEGVIACQQALDSQVSQKVVERVRNNAKALNEESLRKLSLSWI